MHDSGLAQYGLEIVAGFDVRAMKQNNINGIPLYSVNEFSKKREELDAQIGILTVPVEKAQECADYMIANGIKAIWNFTPLRIRVPDDIVVQNTSLYAHLSLMFNRLDSVADE